MRVASLLLGLTAFSPALTNAFNLNLLAQGPGRAVEAGIEGAREVLMGGAASPSGHDFKSHGHGHGHGGKKAGGGALHDMFTEHFSPANPFNEVYLQTTIASLYPNSTVTMTQDYQFNLLGFAASESDQIIIRELDELETIRKTYYVPPKRRREGAEGGVSIQSVTLGGWRVEWGEEELVAIVASWSEGFLKYTQWHLIADKAQTSHSLINAVGSWSRLVKDAILVYNQGYWQPDRDLWASVQGASWKDVILEQGFKDRLQKDYRSFYKSEKIYKDLQVPWKRGLILLGPPGNGKTISLKAIMNDVKVPVLYVKSFKTFMGDEYGIRQAFLRARAEAPCLLVLEDLDALINDMNRSFFLNEVDGIEDNDGLLLIGTTNHFDRLDPALSSRPSRFDRKYNFPNPTRDERRQYAVYWQNKLKSNKAIDFPDSLLDKFAVTTDKFSFAYLKEVFVSTLLTIAGLDDPASAPPFSDIVMEQIKRIREQLNLGWDVTSSPPAFGAVHASDPETAFGYPGPGESDPYGPYGYGSLVNSETRQAYIGAEGELLDFDGAEALERVMRANEEMMRDFGDGRPKGMVIME